MREFILRSIGRRDAFVRLEVFPRLSSRMDHPTMPRLPADTPTVPVALSAQQNATTELLLQVAARDVYAFEQLHTLWGPRILARVTGILRDPAQSEEVTQEVLLEIWLRAASFDPHRVSGPAWIYTKARSRAIDRVRASQTARDRELQAGVLDHVDRTTIWENDTSHVGLDELRVAISHLTQLQQQAILFAYQLEYSHRETAKILGVPVGTVKSRIAGAMTRLRALLTADIEAL